jgi:hypothetical protein
MTREELQAINFKYKKNSDDTSLLRHIPSLLKYIEELEEEISGMNHYFEELDI